MSDVEIITVSARGQIVLPKKTRENMKAEKGTKLLLVEEKGKVTLQKIPSMITKKKHSEGIETYLASEKTLAKDWNYKGDDVWDDL